MDDDIVVVPVVVARRALLVAAPERENVVARENADVIVSEDVRRIVKAVCLRGVPQFRMANLFCFLE